MLTIFDVTWWLIKKQFRSVLRSVLLTYACTQVGRVDLPPHHVALRIWGLAPAPAPNLKKISKLTQYSFKLHTESDSDCVNSLSLYEI